jgi:hypothetical protein
MNFMHVSLTVLEIIKQEGTKALKLLYHIYSKCQRMDPLMAHFCPCLKGMTEGN